MEKIVILCQPKTGTTGTYYKIENSLSDKSVTGLFEPQNSNIDIKEDYQYLVAKVLLREFYTFDYSPFLSFDKIIYIIRDPRDWLISLIIFQMRSPYIASNPEIASELINLLRKKESSPKSVSVYSLVEIIAKSSNKYESTLDYFDWIRKEINWLKKFEGNLKNYHLLRYEDFVDDKLDSLENFLGFNLHKGDAQPAHCHSHTVRTKGYGNWKDWFIESDIGFFQPLFQDYMLRHQYEDDWTLNKNPYLDPKYSSEYVTRNMGWENKV
jgi:hypothetical protein